MEVPENLQSSFEIPKSDLNVPKLEAQIDKLVGLLGKSKRPLLLGGQGVIYADARNEFKQLYKTLNVPTITTRLGIDLIDSSEKLFVGRPGLYGDRPSNFAVQNADLIISVGARLDYGIVGYDSGDWGRNAKIVVVDIDDEELNKPNVKAHIKIKADCRLFMRDLLGKTKREKLPDWNNWVAKCSQWKMKYPMVLPEFRKENPVNSYYFAEVLASLARENDTILLDTSSCFHVVSQAWKVKEGQRFLTTGGISTMGYWVASIGASVAKNKGRVLAITGDGSFQFN
ncbi:thiamine pyrophosphate-binding protein, partial [Candidatus Curtissbacteria bacterium]|nr:thiamine pyrophosphate-binding protein [Candidatus Curtissbacteria bacterium]